MGVLPPTRIVVEIEGATRPVTGAVCVEGEPPELFTGWMGLFSRLTAMFGDAPDAAHGLRIPEETP